MVQTVCELVGGNLDDHALKQMKLPGFLGGMGLRDINECMDASFFAMWVTLRERVPCLCKALGRPAGHRADEVDAMAARASLSVRGLDVDLSGSVKFVADGNALFQTSPWAKETLEQFNHEQNESMEDIKGRTRLLGKIYRGLETLQAAQLWHDLGQHRQECLLSAGGAGTGSFWHVIPTHSRDYIDDLHWRTAFRQRLGSAQVPPGSLCCLKRSGDEEEVCGKVLDKDAQHPMLCKLGPARNRAHNSVARALARLLRSAGASVDFERAWPPLYKWSGTTCTEAIIDLVVHWPGACNVHLLDVTVRCPHAARYETAHCTCGVAAAYGAKDKLERYGPSVRALPLETYGRLGTAGLVLLADLAAEAGIYGSDRWVRSRLVSRWRLAIERVLLFENADVLLIALGCTTRSWSRFSRAGGG